MGRSHIINVPYYQHRGWSLPLYQPQYPYTESSGYILEILQASTSMLDTAMTLRYRSYLGVFSIQYPQEYPNNPTNHLFCKCMEIFLQRIKMLLPIYIWVRERNLSEHQHYHLGLIIDDRYTQSFIEVGQELEYLWNRELGFYKFNSGLVDYQSAERSKCTLLSSDLANYTVYSNAFYKLSYLAKMHSKETDLPHGVRRWMKSQFHPTSPSGVAL